jgi:hypothetical protein
MINGFLSSKLNGILHAINVTHKLNINFSLSRAQFFFETCFSLFTCRRQCCLDEHINGILQVTHLILAPSYIKSGISAINFRTLSDRDRFVDEIIVILGQVNNYANHRQRKRPYSLADELILTFLSLQTETRLCAEPLVASPIYYRLRYKIHFAP